MRHYFKAVMGLNIRRKQASRRVDGVQNKKTVFFIEDMVSSMTSLDNRICDARWFVGVCNAYDAYVLNKLGIIHCEHVHMLTLDDGLYPFTDVTKSMGV